MNQVVFRADSSENIGAGHVMRCLSFANLLSSFGWLCTFACVPGTVESVRPLGRSIHKIILIPFEIEKQSKVIRDSLSQDVNLLVVDHYDLGFEFESESRIWAKKILVIDDLANRTHDADFLLDQTYNRKVSDYKSLVSDNCHIITGSKNSLLRKEFPSLRQAALKRRDASKGKLKQLLVSFGSSDTMNNTCQILEAISNTKLDFNVDVILGSSAPFIDKVKEQIKADSKVKLYVDVDNMAEFMFKADLAIGAGGTTSWERCSLGLPSMTLTIADNQELINENLNKINAIINLGFPSRSSFRSMTKLLVKMNNDSSILKKLSLNSRRISDGNGCMRVFFKIFGYCWTSDLNKIHLELLEDGDKQKISNWLSNESIKVVNPKLLINSLTSNKNDCFLMIKYNDNDAGILWIKLLEKKKIEIANYLSFDFRGHGITRCIFFIVSKLFPGFDLSTNLISKNNVPHDLASEFGINLVNN